MAGFQGVILDPDAFVFAEGVDTWFEPSVEEIERVEEALRPALLAAGRAGPQIAQSLPDYRRQYAGIVRAGRRLVAINAFCRAHWPFAPDWERTQVIAFGGGSCFWYAELDVSTGEPVLINVTGG
ncbi:MAG: hypothetical protein N2037_13155 [Acidimicrobiales bacterium]|nr:hypothetical protein [Acidimicrobiales bacterium]